MEHRLLITRHLAADDNMRSHQAVGLWRALLSNRGDCFTIIRYETSKTIKDREICGDIDNLYVGKCRTRKRFDQISQLMIHRGLAVDNKILGMEGRPMLGHNRSIIDSPIYNPFLGQRSQSDGHCFEGQLGKGEVTAALQNESLL